MDAADGEARDTTAAAYALIELVLRIETLLLGCKAGEQPLAELMIAGCCGCPPW